MSRPGILVVGDVIDDTVVIPSGPIRPDTDTTSTIRRVAGGSAANTAAWLAALGADVSFVGAVGKADVARHTALLPGVDVHLQAVDAATGAIIVLVQGAERSMLTDRGANDITAICLLAAPEGCARLEKELEGLDVPVTVVTAAMDEKLNDKGYIVPGLGDAGDRLYGVVG